MGMGMGGGWEREGELEMGDGRWEEVEVVLADPHPSFPRPTDQAFTKSQPHGNR
jgi:hypothetical protein